MLLPSPGNHLELSSEGTHLFRCAWRGVRYRWAISAFGAGGNVTELFTRAFLHRGVLRQSTEFLFIKIIKNKNETKC